MTAQDGSVMAEVSVPDEIATLPPVHRAERGSALDPRTGEPTRPWVVRGSAGLSWLAAGTVAVGLLGLYWRSISDFANATWLYGQVLGAGVRPDDLILTEVLLTTGVTIGLLAAVISCVITGYYAWHGYDWARWAGAISGGLSLLGLLATPVTGVAIAAAALGAAGLWLPASRQFFDAWTARRHPQDNFAPPVNSVYYGPLPRYRRP